MNLHLIWSTKSRRPSIDPEWADRLYAYWGSIASAKNGRLIVANGERDHVHLYVSLPSTISIADLVNAYKANSTRWIRQTFQNRTLFSWQEGYAAFSVSPSQEQGVIDYINNQHEHHRKRDFREEIVILLERHGIKYDPRYVFD